MQPVVYPKSLMEVTMENIRNAIVSGELPLGSKLSEQRLADELAVSRSPVRDALAALQSEGLVLISPKRGTFVFTPNMRIVDELCEHRTILECAALRLGIERNQDNLVQQLELVFTEMERALSLHDNQRYSSSDLLFHNAIIAGAENQALAKSYNLMISPLNALRTYLFTIMSEDANRSMEEHFELIKAVRAKDTELAVAKLSENIGHLAKAYCENLRFEEADNVTSPHTARKRRRERTGS